MDKTTKIRELNDQFRNNLSGGQVVITQGIKSLEPKTQAEVFRQVRLFNEFTEDNDPYQEHDFGSFEQDGVKIFWKIDYYDQNLEYGSEDPADPEQTTRVLTIMLAEEY